MSLNIGDDAPDFEAPDENGNKIKLSEFKEQYIS